MGNEYPLEDWQYQVANGDTRLGYEDWVAHMKEMDAGGTTDVEFEIENKFDKVQFSVKIGEGWPILKVTDSNKEETIPENGLKVGMPVLVKHPSGEYVKAVIDQHDSLGNTAMVDGKWWVMLKLSSNRKQWLSDAWCNIGGIAKLEYK